MTSEEFARWVNTEFSVSIHEETARKWLHRLGFSWKNHDKGGVRGCILMAMRVCCEESSTLS